MLYDFFLSLLFCVVGSYVTIHLVVLLISHKKVLPPGDIVYDLCRREVLWIHLLRSMATRCQRLTSRDWGCHQLVLLPTWLCLINRLLLLQLQLQQQWLLLLVLLLLLLIVAVPTTWNCLPLNIRNSSSILGFRRQLKSYLYKLAFDPF